MLRFVGGRLWVGPLRGLVLAFLAVQFAGACGLDVSGLQESGTAGDDAGADAMVRPPVDATFDTGASNGDDTGGGGDVAAPGDDAPAADDTGGTMTGNDAPSGDDVALDDSGGSADAPPVDGCTPRGPEQCTNGIDDDCNGLTDCADPACAQQSYTCVTPPPAGWQFVAFDPAAQPGCPSALQTANVDVGPLLDSAQCSCTCKLGVPPTCTGNVTTTYGMNGTCSMMGGMFPADGSCNNRAPVTVMPYLQVSLPTGSGGTCTPVPTTTIPPPGGSQGQICGGESKYGAGCSNGQVCALVPSAFKACVAKNSQVGCPSGDYATSYFVGNLKDTRACSACKCDGIPSCSMTWNFYNSPNCNGPVALTLNPNGNCEATGGQQQMFSSNSLTGSSQNAACGAPTMQPTPTGQITLDAEQTVCCE